MPPVTEVSTAVSARVCATGSRASTTNAPRTPGDPHTRHVEGEGVEYEVVDFADELVGDEIKICPRDLVQEPGCGYR